MSTLYVKPFSPCKSKRHRQCEREPERCTPGGLEMLEKKDKAKVVGTISGLSTSE
jgi:hypothetical protein